MLIGLVHARWDPSSQLHRMRLGGNQLCCEQKVHTSPTGSRRWHLRREIGHRETWVLSCPSCVPGLAWLSCPCYFLEICYRSLNTWRQILLFMFNTRELLVCPFESSLRLLCILAKLSLCPSRIFLFPVVSRFLAR